MSKPLLRFWQNPLTLDLNDQSAYFLYDDFAPPAENTEPLIAIGTSANRRGGGTKQGETSLDRTLTFTVNVRKSSGGSIAQAVNLIRYFVGLAGSKSNPLYLEWAADTDVSPRPLWGQGPQRYYEVLYGTVALAPTFLVGNRKDTDVDVTISLVVGPFALGQPQRLASALGGLVLDNYGTADGRARGLQVAEGVTNKMTNPVFGNATPLTSWTTAASLTSSVNTDPRFVLPGARNSAKLTRHASVSTIFTQSINVGNTNAHQFACLVKKPDSSAVTSSDVEIYYNAVLTTTWRALGDGWYLGTATATGIASGTATGISLRAVAVTVYLGGFMCHEGAYATPFFWGDNLGCAWSGTVHASTSVRTVGRVRVPVATDTFHLSGGTIRIVYRAHVGLATLTTQRLFELDNTGTTFLGQFGTGNQVLFRDGTTTMTPAVSAFAAGDVRVLHFTWGPAGIAVYQSGVLLDDDASYTPPTDGSYLYIGSSTSGTLLGNGTFMDFTIYPVPLSAAEVLADYTNVVQVANDGQRVSAIPWLWTKDGDDVVDNHDDSDADNFCVVGGIPGSVPADTRIELGVSVNSKAAYWLSHGIFDKFIDPSRQFYHDLSGTAAVGTGSGDAIRTNSSVNLQSLASVFPELMNGEFTIFTRLKSAAAASVSLSASVGYGNQSITAPTLTFTATTSYLLYKLGDINFRIPRLVDVPLNAAFISVGSLLTGTFEWDYYMALPKPTKIIPVTTSVADGYILRDGLAVGITAGSSPVVAARAIGPKLEFAPNKVNLLWFISGDHAEANTLSDTATFTNVRVTPRYALL